MLSNAEFAVISGIDTTLEGEMAEFAMFTIDFGDVKAPIGRNKNGKRKFARVNPHLAGKGVNLWDVTSIRATATAAEMRKATAVERILANKTAENERATRVKTYAATVASGGMLFGEDESPADEGDGWDKFFADDTPMVGGRIRRKGGGDKTTQFEEFVDAANS